MGAALTTAFTDFMATTGSAIITPENDVVNEVVKHSYLMGKFLKGGDKSFTLQGGSSIRDILILDEDSTAVNYQPNDTFQHRNPQVSSTYRRDWRFTADHMAWSKQEVLLNNGSGGGAVRGRFKNLKRIKEQRMWTSKVNFMENRLFAEPNKLTMEASDGVDQSSIPAGLNEFTNGLYGAGATGGTWTVFQDIDPAQKPKWVPQVQLYGSSSAAATNADDANRNVIQAFEQMHYKVKFDTPPTRKEYFENPHYGSQFIACSRRGMTVYENLLRTSQDRFTGIGGYQDPAFVNPMFAGVELVYVDQLDTAALYPDADNTDLFAETNSSTDNRGPRYYWINGQYLCPVFHSEAYFEKQEPMKHPNQPFTTVMYVDTWWNLVFRSRQRHGVVAPTGDPYT